MLLTRDGTALLGVEISADGECLDFYAEKDVFESICENLIIQLIWLIVLFIISETAWIVGKNKLVVQGG